MITLYHAPKTRSFAVLWLLEEIGVPYELKRLDMQNGDHKSAVFLKLNPFGKLPTAKDGNTVLTERAAICTYLADTYALGRLAPALDDRRRAEYLRWMFFSVGVMESVFLAKFMHLDVPAAQAPWGTFADVNAVIDGKAAQPPYFLGEQFTAADVMMGTMVRWGLMWDLVEGSHLRGYVDRIESRDAFKRALALDAS